jgi:IS30 family transposase
VPGDCAQAQQERIDDQPGAAAQRLIRQYLPKGTCFKDLTDKHCMQIEEAPNNTPRKKLGFTTPDEAYDEQCCA